MESAGHKSVGSASGAGDGGGHLCHLCGYKFASAHPSAKQRRAHRKNCGVGGGGGSKSPPATATAEVEDERQGKKLLLDECEAEAAGGGAAEGNGAGASDSAGGLPGSAQDVGNAVEDGDNGVHPVNINDITSEVVPEANGTEIQTEVAVQLSENAPHGEDLHPSESHDSADQSQDASASHRQSEREDGERFSPDLSADEISKSNGVSLALNAAAGEIVEDQSATTVDEDLYVNNLGVVTIEQIPSEDTESKEESGVIRTDSVEQALGSEEPSTDKHDDTSSVGLSELDSGGCLMEAADVDKTQQQTDPTSVVAEQLTNPKQADLEEGKNYANTDEVIQAACATGPACSAGDLTKKDPSEVTMEDGIQSNSSHISGTIFVPSQTDLVDPSSDPTSHEINMISSKEDLDENKTNGNISADLTSCDTTEVQSVDTEETASHEIKAVCSTDNVEEIKQIEQITAEASPPESSVLHSKSSFEEKELIEEVIADPASYKVDVISSRDIVVEKEQSDVYVGIAQEINVVDIPANVELKKHNEETTGDPTACETNITNITDNVEEKKQNEDTTTDPALHAINVIHIPGNDDKMQNEDMIEVRSSHENAVVDGTDTVKEKDENPTSYNMDAVNAVDVIEVKKREEEVTAEPAHPEIIAVHTVDNVKEKESEEAAAACKIDAGSNADAVDPSSHENNTPQGTDDAAEKNQNEEVTGDHAGDNILAGQSIDDVAEKKQHKDEPATADIKTMEKANGDQNEEITDKEMTIDSDKSHVSLKSLLSEKGMEIKEKKATSTKDRVLSFRRRSSKDNPSPGKTGSVEQDWNSPARLPVEKSPKGKKQPWMPFICCHSMN